MSVLFFISTPVLAKDTRSLWSNEFLSPSIFEDEDASSPFYWGVSWAGALPRNENEDRLFSLGSVKKIITAATALRELGSDYRFSNEFTGDLDTNQGIVSSPVFSVSGDPTWAHPSYGETLTTRIDQVIEELKRLNVKKVIGEIQVNLLRPAVGQFHRPTEWKKEWLLECYAALPTPVSLNGNCAKLGIYSNKKISWITAGVSTPIDNKLVNASKNSIMITPELNSFGRIVKYVVSGGFAKAVSRSLPVHDNEGWLKNIFIQQLQRAGIAYESKSLQLNPSRMMDRIYVDLSSVKLKEILVPFLEDSINLVGDRLHIEAPQDFITLASLLPDPVEYEQAVLVDGSGLMASNKITPKTFLHLLSALRSQPYFQDLYAGLPISGVSGTLQYRMNDALLKNRVHAKTGTINGVANLAGYWVKADQSLEPFVIFTESKVQASVVKAKIDLEVAEFARKN